MAIDMVDPTVYVAPEAAQPVATVATTPVPVPVQETPVVDPNLVPALAQYGTLIDSMYKQELGRTPEEAGKNYWATQLYSGAITPDQLPSLFNNTPEGFVFDQYANTLKRTPDPGAAYWTNALNSGTMTQDQVAKAIAASNEARALQDQAARAEAAKRTAAGTAFFEDQMANLRKNAQEYAARGAYTPAPIPVATNKAEMARIFGTPPAQPQAPVNPLANVDVFYNPKS